MNLSYLNYLADVDVGHWAVGVSTEGCQAKYLLVKLAQEMEPGQYILGTQKELAKSLGVSASLITSCWQILIEEGYVIDCSASLFEGKAKFVELHPKLTH